MKTWLEGFFLGQDPRIEQVRVQILQAAKTDLPILITGETGTGKDIAAQAIHYCSRRGGNRLQVVAMSGLGDTAWSILFGHRRGAFTGCTRDHKGVFEAACGSSLLFDDVDNIPLDFQPMLLRAVEKGQYRPLGAIDEQYSDCRILATTNVPLDGLIQKGSFRADLYQRLSVLKIAVPPLRDHPSDLRQYVPHFLRRAETLTGRAQTVSREAMRALLEYRWPRNIRELEHLLCRAAVEVDKTVLDAADIARLLEPDSTIVGDRRSAASSRVPIDRSLLLRTLQLAGGNKREAARRLKISPGSLYKLLRQHQVDWDINRRFAAERESP